MIWYKQITQYSSFHRCLFFFFWPFVLSVLLRYTDSDYSCDIFKLFITFRNDIKIFTLSWVHDMQKLYHPHESWGCLRLFCWLIDWCLMPTLAVLQHLVTDYQRNFIVRYQLIHNTIQKWKIQILSMAPHQLICT